MADKFVRVKSSDFLKEGGTDDQLDQPLLRQNLTSKKEESSNKKSRVYDQIGEEKAVDIPKCCGLFSIKTGFYIYGTSDCVAFVLMLTLFIMVAKGADLVKDIKQTQWIGIMLLFFFPNMVSFVIVLANDGVTTRRFYSY